jgi:hypothetical protein
MQEPHNEGLASHIDPESCGYAGNDLPEALTGEDAGRVLSHVSLYNRDRSADAVENVGRRHRVDRYRKVYLDSARSKTPSTHGNSLRRNWEVLCSALQ